MSSAASRGAVALRQARLIALAAGIAVHLLLALSGAGDALSRGLFDRFQRLAPRDLSGSPVVLVGIDGESIAALGDWPWSRFYVARLVRRIADGGARGIGLDMIFPDPDPAGPARFAALYPDLPPADAAAIRALPSGDAAFAEVLGRAPVVLGRAGIEAGSIDMRGATRRLPGDASLPGPLPPGTAAYPAAIANLPALDDVAAGHGLSNGPPDADGVVRRVPLVATAAGAANAGFALELARIATGAETVTPLLRHDALSGVAIGARAVPTDAEGRMAIRFGAFPGANIRSAADVLRRGFPIGMFRGRIVIVGLRAAGAADVVPTPMRRGEFGMFVQAQAVDAILRGGWLARPDWAAAAQAALLAALLAVVLGWLPGSGARAIAVTAGGLGALPVAGSFALFAGAGLLVDPLPALLGAGAAGLVLAALLFADATRARARLRETLVSERVAAARSAGELEAARAIQRGMLPSSATLAALDPAIDVAAVLEPARGVGGDFYDVVRLSGGRIGFLLGDVTGKGVPAALFMALAKALARGALLRAGGDPAAALVALEAELRDNGEETQLTLVAGVLDLASGAARFCNAGHENPLRIGADGLVEELRLDGGPPLCAVDGFPYPVEPVTLRPGDGIVLLSDGAGEARDAAGRLFGAAAVRAALAGGGAPDALAARLVAAVRAHEAGAEPGDDLTCLALRWRGAAG